MCLLFIIDDTTSELVCQVRSCDITYIGAGTWEGRGKGRVHKLVIRLSSTLVLVQCHSLSSSAVVCPPPPS